VAGQSSGTLAFSRPGTFRFQYRLNPSRHLHPGLVVCPQLSSPRKLELSIYSLLCSRTQPQFC
jgi:hypothetical protein